MAAVTTINGVSIYNLSAGKTIPGWVSSTKKKALKKDEDFARRLELLQDFTFPEASQTVGVSGDGRYVVSTGTYPPRVRVWDTLELSMKFERYMDSTPVAHAILAGDYSKLAFLHEDRNVEVHAAYGRHYRTRIPTAGRAMVWHAPTAELLMACSGPEVYRLSLEEGRFASPLVLHRDTPAANSVAVSTVTALIGVACEGGAVEMYDPRSHSRAGRVLVPGAAAAVGEGSGGSGVSAMCLAFEEGGMGLAVGTSDGKALLYDLRHSRPTHVKPHPYKLPVHTVAFHRGPGHLVLSADAKQIKIWGKNGPSSAGASGSGSGSSGSGSGSGSGAGTSNFTTIELPAHLNALTLASDTPGMVGSADSGLILAACEQERLCAFYLPQLGPAPRWASFLDALTEEVDSYGGIGSSSSSGTGTGAGAGAGGGGPSQWGAVYDDYKFLTREEVGGLGLGGLIGTPMLKAFMHGFFMDARLYARVRVEGRGGGAAAAEEARARYRAERVKALVEASRAPRLSMIGGAPKVNAALAARLVAAEEEEEERQRERERERERGRKGAGKGGEEEEEEEEEKKKLKRKKRGREEKEKEAAMEVARKEGKALPPPPPSLLQDSRFGGLFSNPAFTIDEREAEVFALQRGQTVNPGGAGGGKKKGRRAQDEEEEE